MSDQKQTGGNEWPKNKQGKPADFSGEPENLGPEGLDPDNPAPEQDMLVNAPDPRPRLVNRKLLMSLGAGVVVLAIGVIYASVSKQQAIDASMRGEDESVNVSDLYTLPATGANLPGTYEEMRAYNRQKELKEAAQERGRTGVPPQMNVELPDSLQQSGPTPGDTVPQQGSGYNQNDPRLMAARQAAMQRLSARTAATISSSGIKPASPSGSTNVNSSKRGLQQPQQSGFNFPAMPQMAFAPDETLTANNQGAKQDYLEADRESDVYLNQPLLTPASPYQVMAGNIIPSSLITGLNSDLPGMLTAQVRHNVYDSVTGRHLLIPQGTRILGEYSSSITYGQNRALVVWNRLLFPNGRSIVLDGMPGVDLSGSAGFKDKVDYHFWRMMGAAILGSIVATAADAAEDDGDSLSDNVLGGTAETANQTIQQLIKKQLNVQPTIKIRPGYRFNIVVLADMILQPYDPRPATQEMVRR